MAQIWHSILPLFALFGLGCSAIHDRLVADQFCGKFPTLHMCRLRTELEGSLGELQYLLQDATNDVQSAEMSGTTSSSDLAGQPEKRKSTYVRFGKRSASDLLEDVPMKRKSTYVRFGKRSANEFDDATSELQMEKRKSAFVRFG